MQEDLTNKAFGLLTVRKLKCVKNHRRIWECECKCGNIKDIREDSLKKYTRSCGCLILESARQKGRGNKHGMSHTRIYNIWAGMKSRCCNPKDTSYYLYGARGITVCTEWLNDFQAFYEWALENGYADNLTIDRIDVNGNYEPSNCRWATAKEQRENQRQYEITYNGETHTLLEWSDITGIKYATLLWRYNQKWNPEKILDNHNFAEETRFKPKHGKDS